MLLVLDATDGERESLAVARVHTRGADVQVPAVSVVRIVLRGAPEVRVDARVEAAIAVAVARRESGEAVAVRPVAAVVPTARALELSPRRA